MLTFEFIRDLERKEKKTEDILQKLPKNLINEINEYTSNKEKIKTTDSARELENAKKSLKELFKIREKKIMEGAIYTVNTGLSVDNIEENEKHFYENLLNLIKENREKVFQTQPEKPKISDKKDFIVNEDLPEFVGPDMKTYTLKKGEILKNNQLPTSLNHFLVKKKIIKERIFDANTETTK